MVHRTLSVSSIHYDLQSYRYIRYIDFIVLALGI